jgi:hypothetical protein
MKNNNTIKIIIILLLAMLFFKYAGLFTINFQSDNIQYFNKPIEAKFTLANYTSPEIKAFFNEQEIYEESQFNWENITEEVTRVNETTNESYVINETKLVKVYPNSSSVIQSFIYTYLDNNGTYTLKLTNVTEEGIFKIVVSEGNKTPEVQVIEVKKPYVKVIADIPQSVERNTRSTLEVKTYNPQGEKLSADSVDIVVSTPDSVERTIDLVKVNETDSNTFRIEYDYLNYGAYNFKIHARLPGYETLEEHKLTTVLKTEGIHPIIWVWTIAIILYVILFLLNLIGKKKR